MFKSSSSCLLLALAGLFLPTTYGDGLLRRAQQQDQGNPKWKFGMASGGSSFFEPIREGFLETCEKLGVECVYYAENSTFTQYHDTWAAYNFDKTKYNHCVPQMQEMIDRKFDGISLYCGVDHPVLQQAMDAGIVLSSFDIKPPKPYDMPYVGTDNGSVGEAMARLLRLLKPISPGETGEYYAFSFTRIPERYQGFVAEIEKNNHRQDRGHWKMVTTNLMETELGDNLTIGEELYSSHQDEVLERLAQLNPDAIIFMNQSPMRRPGYAEWRDRHRHRNITIVGLQGSEEELQIMARHNVDGLIGQVAYDIGRLSAQVLYKQKAGEQVPEETFTKLINYNLVPEQLPDPQVEQNLLPTGLRAMGFILFSCVALFALFCMAWTYKSRKGTVVRSSQPIFLIMTATGVLIMAGAIIPLSFDFSDEEMTDLPAFQAKGVCMSVPWLACLGFSITFAALFSKTWRVNQFFQSSQAFARIQVREKDVLAPFVVVLSLNIIVLVLWTVIDPLEYTREFENGTDLYNREIESNGYCRSDDAPWFLAALAIINLSVLVVASKQAYNARNIKSEFAESSYIALAVFSLAQAFCTGLPVVVVVKDDPQAFYVVLTCVLFVLSMAILLLIFLPKIFMDRKYAAMTPLEQRKLLAVSVRSSQRNLAGLLTDPSSSGSRRQISGLHPPPSRDLHARKVAMGDGDHHNFDRRPLVRVTEGGQEDDEEAKSTPPQPEGADMTAEDDTGSTMEYGSYVSRIEEDNVVEIKRSTYASEELDAELLAKEEVESASTTQNQSSETRSSADDK